MRAQVRRMMRPAIRYFTSAAALLTLAACEAGESSAQTEFAKLATGQMAAFEVTEGGELPELIVYDREGEARNLEDDLAEVTLVNLWATWCPPCVVEMPSLEALQESYDPARFRVVPVSLDQTAEKALDFYQRQGLEALPFRHDPEFVSAGAFAAPGLPISVLYDAQGNEIGRLNGPAEWDSPEAKTLIDAALAADAGESGN